MQARSLIPIIDLAFLSLGAIVAVLSQTQVVKSLPIEITEVAEGIAAMARDDLVVVTIAEGALRADGQPVTMDELPALVGDRLAVLRVERDVPTERLVSVMGQLAGAGVEVRIEVAEQTP